MEDAEDSTFILKPEKQWLGSRSFDFEPSDIRPERSTFDDGISASTTAFYIVFSLISTVFAVALIYALVKCCMSLLKEGDELNEDLNTEYNARRILHLPPGRPHNQGYLQQPTLSGYLPPGRLNNQGYFQQSTLSGSRPLAPPRTSSSSLILFPEERHLQTLFQNIENPAAVGIENPAAVGIENPVVVGIENPAVVGIENPAVVGIENPAIVGIGNPSVVGIENTNYDIPMSGNQDGKSSNPTPLLDLPPDYETAIRIKSEK